MWESKVYLHTYVNEAFGISIVEAIAAGCVLIVHNSGGPREFVTEHLRYETTQEAVKAIEKAVDQWSPNFLPSR